MGKGKRKGMPVKAKGAKDRHKVSQRARLDHLAPPMDVLVAKPAVPKSKHHSYFEFVENKNKKKKLELQDTPNRSPPPGFEFVPNGNAKLTKACKELSREKDAMVFLVSAASDGLSRQVNRLGIHVRQTIVDEARATMSDLPQSGAISPDGKPEPIPQSQAEYHVQADEALRDLFPRIPNTDRQIIIDHAFTRRLNVREQPVGFSDDIPLARRVQLAVLAHIRHTHTRYDDLLREAGWQAARKAVEALCLDIIVKWRGDEETGRDQLDEILREVVVISDSEDDGSDDDSTDGSTAEESGCSSDSVLITQPLGTIFSETVIVDHQHPPGSALRTVRAMAPARRITTQPIHYTQRTERNDRKNQRGFKRYRAWQEAIIRSRAAEALGPDFRGDGLDEHDSSRRQDHEGYNQIYQHTAYNCGEVEHNFPTVGPTMVSSNQVRRNVPVYPRPVGIGSCPTYASRATEVQLQPCGKEMHPTMSGHLVNSSSSSSSRLMMSPVSNCLQDMPVPSIEPPSPETMKPAFIRAIRPRQQDPMDYLSARTQELLHNVGTLSPMDNQIRNSSGYGPRLVISDHTSDKMSRPSELLNHDRTYECKDQAENYFQSKAAFVEPRPHQSWTRSYAQPVHFDKPADRIIVNASRPGTRTNPVIMEDRGGFYEKIVLPPDTRESAHHSHGVTVSSSRLDLNRTNEAYRAPLSRECARALENDNWGYSNVEAIPLTPLDSHYRQSYHSPVHLQARSYPRPLENDGSDSQNTSGRPFVQKGWPTEELQQRSHQDPLPSNPRTSQRSGKRSVADDHYQNVTRGPRPRSRQPENVIVLD